MARAERSAIKLEGKHSNMGFGYAAFVEMRELWVAKDGSKSNDPGTVLLEVTSLNPTVKIAPAFFNRVRLHCLEMEMPM